MSSRILKQILGAVPYKFLDRFYVPLDKGHIRRTKNIRLIPFESHRRGGKYSYAEWAYVIGIFQTLLSIHLDGKEDGNLILDVGCGTGLVAIASEPFLGEKGRYTGIDVVKRDVDFCRRHYPSSRFDFVHVDVNNAMYAPSQERTRAAWNLESEHFDLVTALSVWTHFNEDDALFYMKEVYRVLQPGGKAIITFFVLDELYERSLPIRRSGEPGRYHLTSQDSWVFDQAAYGSEAFFSPQWAKIPESAIGVTSSGLDRLIAGAELKLVTHYPGNWKEVPGVFFQDVLVLRKGCL